MEHCSSFTKTFTKYSYFFSTQRLILNVRREQISSIHSPLFILLRRGRGYIYICYLTLAKLFNPGKHPHIHTYSFLWAIWKLLFFYYCECNKKIQTYFQLKHFSRWTMSFKMKQRTCKSAVDLIFLFLPMQLTYLVTVGN